MENIRWLLSDISVIFDKIKILCAFQKFIIARESGLYSGFFFFLFFFLFWLTPPHSPLYGYAISTEALWFSCSYSSLVFVYSFFLSLCLSEPHRIARKTFNTQNLVHRFSFRNNNEIHIRNCSVSSKKVYCCWFHFCYA